MAYLISATTPFNLSPLSWPDRVSVMCNLVNGKLLFPCMESECVCFRPGKCFLHLHSTDISYIGLFWNYREYWVKKRVGRIDKEIYFQRVN
jgi:hypothetical protein